MACRQGGYLPCERDNRNIGRRDETAIGMLRQTRDGQFDVGNTMNREIDWLDGEPPRSRLEGTKID
jgi:hypothetical protein